MLHWDHWNWQSRNVYHRFKKKDSWLSKVDLVGYGSFFPGLAMFRAHGYTQSCRQTWNDFNHDHYLLWPQINYPVFLFFFIFKAQPIQVHNGVAYVSHMGPEILRNGIEISDSLLKSYVWFYRSNYRQLQRPVVDLTWNSCPSYTRLGAYPIPTIAEGSWSQGLWPPDWSCSYAYLHWKASGACGKRQGRGREEPWGQFFCTLT